MKKRIMVFAGDKGGVSKTTTAVILACGLGLPLRDLDPSRTGARWIARRAKDYPLPISDGQAWVADCPPGIRGELIPVLRESDLVLVPVRPGFTDLDVLAHTLRFVSAHAVGDIGFLLAGIDQRTKDEERLRQHWHRSAILFWAGFRSGRPTPALAAAQISRANSTPWRLRKPGISSR